MMMCGRYASLVVLVSAMVTHAEAFSSWTGHSSLAHRYSTAMAASNAADLQGNSLLQEFTIHSGEVINPYQVLKVSRQADRAEIKRSYRNLSRRYHPDGNMHKRDILPGKCNNWDEVREHWERIKLAYEILSDPKRRKRYDRHEALADPGAAVKRAAVDAAFSGVAGIGKGLFSMGGFALEQLKKHTDDSKEQKAT